MTGPAVRKTKNQKPLIILFSLCRNLATPVKLTAHISAIAPSSEPEQARHLQLGTHAKVWVQNNGVHVASEGA
jgi:hypothetical protein